MANRTTKRHLAIYKGESLRCRNDWGLSEWDLHVAHDDLEAGEFGAAYFDLAARSATVVLAKTWPQEITNAEILDTAREEMAHVLLAEVTVLLHDRHAPQSQCEGAIEAVVKRLKHILP